MMRTIFRATDTIIEPSRGGRAGPAEGSGSPPSSFPEGGDVRTSWERRWYRAPTGTFFEKRGRVGRIATWLRARGVGRLVGRIGAALASAATGIALATLIENALWRALA